MTEQKAFTVEVPVAAPAAAVWAALRDPVLIAQWHGWDYDGLEAEIQVIYFNYATEVPPHRLDLSDGTGRQRLVMEERGAGSVVRVSREGATDDGVRFDMIEEGWLQFFSQLRYLLERRPAGQRRTIFLEGDAAPATVATALPDRAPGAEWHRAPHQLGWAAADGSLIVAASPTPLTSTAPAPLMVTVSTFGLDDAAFAAAQMSWGEWWASLAMNPRATPELVPDGALLAAIPG